MADLSAVHAALALARIPAQIATVRGEALPPGMTELLAVAAGDRKIIELAEAETGLTEAELCDAAGFFIEQVLFQPQADSYRTLGAEAGSPATALRRHMALLAKALHPDRSEVSGTGNSVDRSVFIDRVTRAWDTLKTEERRIAYGLSHRQQSFDNGRRPRTHNAASSGSGNSLVQRKAASKSARNAFNTTSKAGQPLKMAKPVKQRRTKKKVSNFKRLTVVPVPGNGWFSRLILHFRGRR